MAGTRKLVTPDAPTYKTKEDMQRCEAEGAHRAVVHRWPPPETGLTPGAIDATCTKCRTNLSLEKWHGEPNDWIEVVVEPRPKTRPREAPAA